MLGHTHASKYDLGFYCLRLVTASASRHDETSTQWDILPTVAQVLISGGNGVRSDLDDAVYVVVAMTSPKLWSPRYMSLLALLLRFRVSNQ